MGKTIKYISVLHGKSHDLINKKTWLRLPVNTRTSLLQDRNTQVVDDEGELFLKQKGFQLLKTQGWLDELPDLTRDYSQIKETVIAYISVLEGKSFKMINKSTWASLPVRRRIELLVLADTQIVDKNGDFYYIKEAASLLKEQGWMVTSDKKHTA